VGATGLWHGWALEIATGRDNTISTSRRLRPVLSMLRVKAPQRGQRGAHGTQGTIDKFPLWYQTLWILNRHPTMPSCPFYPAEFPKKTNRGSEALELA